MKIAIWRYGLPLNNAGQSTVGGGKITRAVLDALQQTGAELVAVGNVNRGALADLARRGIAYHPEGDLTGCDAAVILTGPANALYGGYRHTYKLLKNYTGKALYLQWDAALPFHFCPRPFKGEKIPWPTKPDWYLLTQVEEARVRTTGSLATGYANEPFTVVPCFFELLELAERDAWLPARTDDIEPRIAYFGSDRPARLRTLEKWFTAPEAPPIDVYGRWSDKNMDRFRFPNITFKGPVAEGEVRARLNRYAGAVYVTEPGYVRSDFIAQRLFENAAAGVPTAYLDPLQPSVERMLQEALADTWVMRSPIELARWFEDLIYMTPAERGALVEAQSRVVQGIRRYKPQPPLEEALAGVLNA